MFDVAELTLAFLIAFFSSFLLVYPVKALAVKIGAIDLPEYRKIHKNATPRLGGLAIFAGSALGLLYLQPIQYQLPAIMVGVSIILILGIIDDKYQIRPVVKLLGQLIAAWVIIDAGLIIERITLPFIGLVELHGFSILITFLWVVGITNAINLIDGLDGLASGVSTIAFMSILVLAVLDTQLIVVYLCTVLIGSNIGFLFHNFHPAKIYMGDTGSMFLGFFIAIISLLGLFKEVTLFSFIIPIVVLAVPILDTFFAMISRLLKGESIMQADNKHIHYRLLGSGFSHRTTVLIIYGFSIMFGLLGIFFSNGPLWLSLLIAIILFILIHIFAELTGIIFKEKRPVVSQLKKMIDKRKSVKNKNDK